jgi:plastocyanin
MSPDPDTTRRTLLRTVGATGVAGLLAGCLGETAASDPDQPTTASTSETGDTETTAESTTTEGPDSDRTYVVTVGPDGDQNSFAPSVATVDPGTTVRFEWASDGHNVVPTDQPDGADWQGHESLESAGFEYEHVFETPGQYAYVCEPHESLGMKAAVQVRDPASVDAADAVTTDTIEVGPGGENVFAPGSDRPAEVSIGESVTFVWQADNHNVVPTDQPAAADWEGHEALEGSGFEASFTFEEPGRYDFVCTPHRALGMTGTLFVTE